MIIRKRNEPKKSLESFLFWRSLGMYFINREDFRQMFSIKYGDFILFFAPPPPQINSSIALTRRFRMHLGFGLGLMKYLPKCMRNLPVYILICI
jgi:hypothetical protein